eukprot:361684-Chlamydomonas_euryale.AAC.14
MCVEAVRFEPHCNGWVRGAGANALARAGRFGRRRRSSPGCGDGGRSRSRSALATAEFARQRNSIEATAMGQQQRMLDLALAAAAALQPPAALRTAAPAELAHMLPYSQPIMARRGRPLEDRHIVLEVGVGAAARLLGTLA